MPQEYGVQPPRTYTNLPGKNIKPQSAAAKPGRYASPQHLEVAQSDADSTPRGRASPLGITIDTNTNTNGTPYKPEQLYPQSRPRDQTKGSTGTTSPPKKKKGHVPAPLDLEKELSPFDRVVPIVLSNPNTPGSNGLRNRKTGQMKALTPIIVVSPVHSPSKDKSPIHNIARPTSSICTRAFSSMRTAGLPTPAFGKHRTPPVPQIKSPYAAAGRRPVSDAVTIFEDVPDSATSRRWLSPDPNAARESRGSMEMVPPTPRRSKGWWNLLSPVTPKSLSFPSTTPKRSFTAPARIRRDQPDSLDKSDLPILARAAPMAESNPRGVENGVNWPLNSPGLQRQGTQRTIPTYGEASKYYFPEYDYGRPDDGARGIGAVVPGAYAGSPPQDNVEAHDRSISPDKSVSPSSPAPAPVPMPAHPPTPKDESPVKPTVVRMRDPDPIISPPPEPTNNKRIASAGTTSKETPSTSATMSPAVVENASVARVHPAQDIQAKRYQRSPLPPLEEVSSHQRPASVSSEPAHDADKHGQRDTDEDPRWKHFWSREERETQHHNTTRHDFVPPLQEESRYYTARLTPSEKQPTPPAAHRCQFAEPRKCVKPAESTAQSKKARFFLILVVVSLFLLTLITVILAMTVVRHHSDMPIQAAWLNLTGYPPMPTGISTVAQPDIKQARSSCVSDQNLWSCAMPQEQQPFTAPNPPDQPNFRFEIRYAGNDKTLRNSTSSSLSKRDIFGDLLKIASPSPPKKEEQAFLGNTTDRNVAPFAGEDTPFTMSVLPLTLAAPANGTSHATLARRSNNTTEDSLAKIPSPLLAPNATVAPAMLYPFPAAQPLKLFNRGKDDEHYGFYSYFDRSIFLTLDSAIFSSTSSNGSATMTSGSSDDNTNGGVPRTSANAVCTFTQTRFLVQLWTVADPPSTTPSSITNSASAFTRPGSFPYAVTISTDRHGGDASKKGVFCHGIDDKGKVDGSRKFNVDEDRAVDGMLVNAAKGALMEAAGGDGVFGDGQSGVDGGSGGCGCRWANW